MMTEAEWLTCNEPSPMLALVSKSATLRKGRLFALAYCKRVEHLLTADEKRCRKVISLLELRIEGLVDENELQAASSDVIGDVYDAAGGIGYPGHVVAYATSDAARVIYCVTDQRWASYAASAAAAVAYEALTRSVNAELEEIASRWGRGRNPARLGEVAWNRDQAAVVQMPEFQSAGQREEQTQAILLRDIFGNPFRAVMFDTRWRSETTVALASAIYAERAFDRLPILADALEDAGCDDLDILSHCRGPGPHVRGCWVVDLVLGKE